MCLALPMGSSAEGDLTVLTETVPCSIVLIYTDSRGVSTTLL